jgi:hypothetical protein
MRRTNGIFRTGLLSVGLALFGCLLLSQSNGFEPLEGSQLKLVRGANPGPCDSAGDSNPCTDQSSTCIQYDGDQTNCPIGTTCPGCSSNALELTCNHQTGINWNVICVWNVVDGGCGVGFTAESSGCQWNAEWGTCRCNGEPGTASCNQYSNWDYENLCAQWIGTGP